MHAPVVKSRRVLIGVSLSAAETQAFATAQQRLSECVQSLRRINFRAEKPTMQERLRMGGFARSPRSALVAEFQASLGQTQEVLLMLLSLLQKLKEKAAYDPRGTLDPHEPTCVSTTSTRFACSNQCPAVCKQ